MQIFMPFLEIVSEAKLADVVSQMPGYCICDQ